MLIKLYETVTTLFVGAVSTKTSNTSLRKTVTCRIV